MPNPVHKEPSMHDYTISCTLHRCPRKLHPWLGLGVSVALLLTEATPVHAVLPSSVVWEADEASDGTGSVSCNSVFVRYLDRFLNQEELMEPEATVQNP